MTDVAIEYVIGFNDVNGMADSIDPTVTDDVVTWEWLNRVLNKSGKFEVDEMVEYWFGLVPSCDEKGEAVEDGTNLVATDPCMFSSEV